MAFRQKRYFSGGFAGSENLQEDIKTGKFKNAYLLFGEEAYLKIQYKEKLIHALNPDDDTMNFTKL